MAILGTLHFHMHFRNDFILTANRTHWGSVQIVLNVLIISSPGKTFLIPDLSSVSPSSSTALWLIKNIILTVYSPHLGCWRRTSFLFQLLHCTQRWKFSWVNFEVSNTQDQINKFLMPWSVLDRLNGKHSTQIIYWFLTKATQTEYHFCLIFYW